MFALCTYLTYFCTFSDFSVRVYLQLVSRLFRDVRVFALNIKFAFIEATTEIKRNLESIKMQWKREKKAEEPSNSEKEKETVVIVGAGIVGLALSLALKEHVGIIPEIYEQASGFQEGIGAGIGLYPNGLRVIRNISTELLERIQNAGYPYLVRRWEVRR